MNLQEINKIIDTSEELTLKEKSIIKKTYFAVRQGFDLNDKKSEIKFLASYIAFVKIGLTVGA